MSTKSQGVLFTKTERASSGPVECLGITFENDEARRAFFLERLQEKLRNPAFRSTPGFPQGSDEDILRLSDPPYYTACPNPFLSEFVRTSGKPFDPAEVYHRDPFSVDVSEGKSDPLYKAHTYHTKVPHLAIVPSILHYTKPGDLVLDAFCGTGSTGVAAHWCATAPKSYRDQVEKEWERSGRGKPEWGARRVVLGDLAPAATTIAQNYNLPFRVSDFQSEAERLLAGAERDLGWMYQTVHPANGSRHPVDFFVWSEVLSCPECAAELVFFDTAFDAATGSVDDKFNCPECSAEINKRTAEPVLESFRDGATGEVLQRPRRVLKLIAYRVGKKRMTKQPDSDDLAILAQVRDLPLPSRAPTMPLPDMQMARVGRMRTTHTTHLHHFFFKRTAVLLSTLWERAEAVEKRPIRLALLAWIESQFRNLSILNRYRPHVTFPYNPLSGVFYVSAMVSEADPFTALRNKLKRLDTAFDRYSPVPGSAIVTTGDAGAIGMPDASVDYIFTDPPFGENIYYSDLNILSEAWYGVQTATGVEAIIDRARAKGVHEYQGLMRRCFSEYYRVLKPGRWMTVVFSNASNAVWRAIQEAMGTAGFVVADVRTLDKKQGSFKQVTSSAVKQDLVISAYKPTGGLAERFSLSSTEAETVWAFVEEHLGNVTQSPGEGDRAAVIAERTPQMLLDRTIAFFVQRGVAVPVSGPEFLAGLAQRYPERDGMYFLAEQVAAYDRQRAKVAELKQLDLFVTDEASAIQWVRQQLQTKPQKLQDLTPAFIREVQSWAKHEETVELRTILEQNFLRYDGTGPVPSQIHGYLSSAYHEMRGLEKTDPALIAKAQDRWYVPDPNKQAEREKIRERELLKEFEEYKASRKKLKQFRTEAVRAGFKAAYDRQDYRTIVDVANRLPESVLQEDEKLLMYYDVASMRLDD